MHLFCHACNGSSDVGSTDERLCQHCGSDFVEIQVRLTDDLDTEPSRHVASCFALLPAVQLLFGRLAACELASMPTIATVPFADATRGGSPAAGVSNAVPARHVGARAAVRRPRR